MKKIIKISPKKIYISLIFVIPCFILIHLYMYKLNQKQIREFPHDIRTIHIEGKVIYKGLIINVFNRGVYIKTSDNKRFNAFGPYSDEKHYFLTEFINEGDSLYKRSDSDTIYLYRDNEEYIFRIR